MASGISNLGMNSMEIQQRPAHYGGLISILKARRKNTLDIKSFVPGHGPMGKPAAFDKLIAYLWWLLRKVDVAIRLGLTSTTAIEAITLDTLSRVTVQSGLASQFVKQQFSSLECFVDLSGIGQGTRSPLANRAELRRGVLVHSNNLIELRNRLTVPRLARACRRRNICRRCQHKSP